MKDLELTRYATKYYTIPPHAYHPNASLRHELRHGYIAWPARANVSKDVNNAWLEARLRKENTFRLKKVKAWILRVFSQHRVGENAVAAALVSRFTMRWIFRGAKSFFSRHRDRLFWHQSSILLLVFAQDAIVSAWRATKVELLQYTINL